MNVSSTSSRRTHFGPRTPLGVGYRRGFNRSPALENAIRVASHAAQTKASRSTRLHRQRCSSDAPLAGLLLAIAVLSALAVSLAWWCLIGTITGLVVIPDGVAYPADWPALSAAAQNNWFRAHAVTLKGPAAVEHMLQHFSLFWQQFAAVGALTLSSALAALVAFALMTRRAGRSLARAVAPSRLR